MNARYALRHTRVILKKCVLCATHGESQSSGMAKAPRQTHKRNSNSVGRGLGNREKVRSVCDVGADLDSRKSWSYGETREMVTGHEGDREFSVLFGSDLGLLQ